MIKEKEKRRGNVLLTLLCMVACFGQVFMVQVLEMVGPELLTYVERKRDKKKVQ